MRRDAFHPVSACLISSHSIIGGRSPSLRCVLPATVCSGLPAQTAVLEPVYASLVPSDSRRSGCLFE